MLFGQALSQPGSRRVMGSRRSSARRRRSTSRGAPASTPLHACAGRRTPSPRPCRVADVRLGWLLLGLGIVVALLLGAWLGAVGPLVVCGADGAAVCVTWPAWISGLTW